MNALLVLMLLAISAAVSYAVGVSRGRSVASRGPTRERTGAADAYQAGYLAGHVAGWRDAEAKRQGRTMPVEPAMAVIPQRQAPTYLQSPVRLPAPTAMPAAARQQPVRLQSPAARSQQQPIQQPPIRRETPEELAARKEKRDQQNINITLYVASLLLVAAGALFVGTSLPGLFRFLGIWFITALFYVSGLIIHARVPRLRPAAVAFVGTGLALIPVTGLAMYNFVLNDAPAAWLVTSLLGSIAYIYTALRLDNRMLAFLSLSFVVSTAWSGVSILGGALVWYFTALIGVAILLTLGALIRPRWLPSLYIRPLMVLHPYVVPAVALAVTLTPAFLSRGEYAMVMFMCGSYFAVMAFVPGTMYKVQHYYGARAAITLAILGVVWDVSADVSTVMLAAVACLGVQALGVAFGGRKLTPGLWWNDAVSCLGLQLVVAAVLTVMLGVGSFDVPEYAPLGITMLTAMAVGWKLAHGTEFAPAAVLVVGIPFAGLLGMVPISVLLTSAGLYWFLRAAVQPGDYRQQLVLAGRLALTLAVPAIVASALEESPDRATYSLVALVAAAGVQQVVNAALVRGGVRLLAPQASLAAFGGAAIAGLSILPVLDDAAGHPAVAASVLLVLSAGVASGILMFPATRRTASDPAGWRPTLAEFLVPATAAVTGVVAAATVSLMLFNVVLAVAAGYFSLTALRIPVSFHRQCYWWLARASGTMLAASAWVDAANGGVAFRLAGEIPSTALVVVAAAATQLVLPMLATSRRRYPRSAMIDASVVVAVMAAATTFLTVTSVMEEHLQRDGWQPGLAALMTAVGATVSGVVFRRHRAAWVFAPAALVLLLALRAGNVRDVEILLGIFAVYSGVMVGVVRERLARGGYLLGMRVLISALAILVVADATDSASAVSIAAAMVLMLQHIATLLVRRRGVEAAFEQATVWATLAAQLLLPLAYGLTGNYDDGGRWVIILELVGATVAAAMAWRSLRVRGAQYIGVAALTAGVVAAGPALVFPTATWLSRPLLDEFQVPVALLSCALAAICLRAVSGARKTMSGPAMNVIDRWFWFISAVVFTVAGGVLAVDVSSSMTGLGLLVLAAVLFAASHFERMPAFYAGAAPAVLAGAIPIADGLLDTLPEGVWAAFAVWLVGGVGTGLALYTVKLLGVPAIAAELWRKNSLTATAAVALTASALVGLGNDQTAFVGALLVVAAGVMAVVEVPVGKWLAGELAAVASLAALQRALLFVDGSAPDWFWAAQWYVAAGTVIAGLRYIGGQKAAGLLRLCVAAGVLSLTSLGTIFGGTSSEHLYVLVGHVLLIVVGLLLAERVLVGWGAVGVALSVMWALRSYAFAMLALVALALIVLAVWRLNRKSPPPGGAELLDQDPDGENPTTARSRGGIR
ncbi:hypothetical protein ACFRJ9_16800 [Paenarthrobacter sp. NPDC056912]|uniref:hypothetical protein n=1 Tax=Paenarthrobacter sp. NPDC056912 TaxID=3345965 RepID=UPI00366B1F74